MTIRRLNEVRDLIGDMWIMACGPTTGRREVVHREVDQLGGGQPGVCTDLLVYDVW